MCTKKIVIEQTRDLICLKFVTTDFSPKITSPSTGENSGDLARSPCYSAVSALLMIPLPDHFNYSPLCHTHYLTPDQYFTGLFRPDPLPSRELETNTALLQRFTAESSRDFSALRKLNNKQRQVSCSLFSSLQVVNSVPFCLFSLYLYPLSAPFLNPLSSPSPPSLLSLLINSLSS